MTILLGRHSDDYATMKVLTTLPDLGTIYTIDQVETDGFQPTTPLTTGEDIFIVGHGYPGYIWKDGHDDRTITGSFEALIENICYNLPEGWTGTLMVLTCRAGVPETEGKSVIGKVEDCFIEKSDELKALGIHNIRIKGGKGYSYGSISAGELGQTAILDANYNVFYSGDYGSNQRKMNGKLPKNKQLKSNRRRAKSGGGIRNYEKPGSSADTAKAWVAIRDDIETDLNEGIQTVSNQGRETVEDTIAVLQNSRNESHQSWIDLLTEQEKEFTFYNMFMDADEAFETITVTIE